MNRFTKAMTMLLLLFMGQEANSQIFAKKFDLPDGKIARKKVCDDCNPGSLGIMFYFKSPFAPDVDNNSTERNIAYQIVGHTFPENSVKGDRALTCSMTSENPFSIDDITTLGSTGKDIDYVRKEKLNLNVQAAVKTNLD